MSYEYNLDITEINVNSKDYITALLVSLKENSQVIDISNINFSITSIPDGNTIAYTINPIYNIIIFETPLSHEIAITIQAYNPLLLKSSNIVLVDFKKEFIDGTAFFNYTTPNTPGNYTLKLKSPDEIMIPPIYKSLIITAPIDPNKSSITFDKSYLPQKVNDTIELKITLKDTNGTMITGIEEVEFTTLKNI